MSRAIVTGILCLGSVAFLAAVWDRLKSPDEIPVQNLVTIAEAAPPCPWRDAEVDLATWFPGATGYEIRNVILSARRLEIQERLGRPAQSDELALHHYLVRSNTMELGTVLTRRVKTPNGAAELALALDTTDKVTHFKIHRIREPDETVKAFATLDLPGRILGKKAAECTALELPLVESNPAVPAAKAILEGARAVLILHSIGRAETQASHRH